MTKVIEEKSYQNTKNPNQLSTIIERESMESSVSSNYVKKIAANNPIGMPIIPKGMILTKPSQVHKQEQALAQRKKSEENQ